MKSTVEEKGAWQRAITITLDSEEVERQIDQIVAKYRQKAVVPGFRASSRSANRTSWTMEFMLPYSSKEHACVSAPARPRRTRRVARTRLRVPKVGRERARCPRTPRKVDPRHAEPY